MVFLKCTFWLFTLKVFFRYCRFSR